MTLQNPKPPPADPSSRAKLVWGRTGLLTAVACLTLGVAANTFAGDKPNRHAHPGPKVKLGQVNSQVKPYAVDDEVTSRVRKGKANDTVNLLVTELPGRDLPARFK